MQLHKPTFPYWNPVPPKFTSRAPFLLHTSPKTRTSNLVSLPDFTNGFSNSAKRVLKSQTRLRNRSGLISVKCEMSEGKEKDDGFYMRRCVELARKAIGCTSPNPMVGCVIFKDGQIVGQGFHPKAGQPHAEVFALRDAGNLAEDATAYVSLEPCNHYGRTPPCTEALINAKVKKVVVGMVDPNPIVASKGVERLRAAGIDVTVAVEEELCKRLNEAYIHHMLTRKPFITLRYSLSINGCLQNELGEGATESGGYYSQLLQEYDAIIHFPTSLTKFTFHESQESGANQPLQILIARNPSSSIEIPASQTSPTSKIIIFTDKVMDTEPETARNGVESVVLDLVNLDAILEYCNRQGMCSVLVDLRGNFGEFDEFIGKNMLQKVVIEILPVWDHASEEQRSRLALQNLEDKLTLKNLTPRISNGSVLIEGYFL